MKIKRLFFLLVFFLSSLLYAKDYNITAITKDHVFFIPTDFTISELKFYLSVENFNVSSTVNQAGILNSFTAIGDFNFQIYDKKCTAKSMYITYQNDKIYTIDYYIILDNTIPINVINTINRKLENPVITDVSKSEKSVFLTYSYTNNFISSITYSFDTNKENKVMKLEISLPVTR